MEPGKVVALHLKPRPGSLVSVDELIATAGKGFEGDRCYGQGSRQALIISTENLDRFGYQPGELREQITTNLPGIQELPVGTKLQVGECVLSIESDCAPCDGMAKRLGEEPAAFKAKTARQRGMLAMVEGGGRIHVGDEVRVLGD